MFWGLIMDSGKKYTQTVERAFHVSMACLEPNTADNENVSVMLVFDNKEFILCNLNKHKATHAPLDLNFQSGDQIAFMSTGKGRIHLTGYLLETDDDDDDEDEDEEDDLDLEESNNLNDSDPFKDIKRTGKRKNEPQSNKTDTKKIKVEAENEGESSDEDENDETFSFGNDSDEGGSDEEDDGDDDEDDDEEEEEEDEDSSDEEMETESPKQKAQGSQKKEKQKQKSPNVTSQLNKTKTPNEKQKNKSLIEKQDKNERPVKTPNEKSGKTPNQKTPNNQMNGISGQQQSGKQNKKGQDTPKSGKQTPKKVVLQGGVSVEDLKVGQGPVAKPGRQVTVYYVGRLKNNNKQFDSVTEGSGFKFRLGRGEVIKGWDIGVNSMRVGGKRKIVCPAALAYGNKGSPPVIPPNSDLVFDVELRGVN